MTRLPLSTVSDRAHRQRTLTAGATAGVAIATAVGFSLTRGLTPRSLAGIAIGFVALTAVVVWTVTRTTESAGSQPLTVATWVTLARGWLLVPFAGLLFVAPVGETVAWISGGLFAVAALLDVVDGALARRTDSVSELGGRLDTEVDSLLVLLGAVAVVIAGSASVLFLAVGVARYAFVAGIRWRRARGLPVSELDPSQRRRITGALVMVVIWLAILPVLSDEASRTAATIGAVTVLAGFARDWLFVSGRIGG